MLDRIIPAVWPPIAVAIETVAKTFPNTGVKLVKRINGNRRDVDVYLTAEDFQRVDAATNSPEFYAWMEKNYHTLRCLATERFGDFDKPVKAGRKQAAAKKDAKAAAAKPAAESSSAEPADKPARKQRDRSVLIDTTPIRMVPVKQETPAPAVAETAAKAARFALAGRLASLGMY